MYIDFTTARYDDFQFPCRQSYYEWLVTGNFDLSLGNDFRA